LDTSDITTCGLITFTVIIISYEKLLLGDFSTWVIVASRSRNITNISYCCRYFAGIAGGMIWALIAGLLKFYGGVSEIFAGLGLNFIATALTIYLIFGPWKRPGVASMSGTVPFDEVFRLPNIPGLRLSPWSLTLAIISVIVVFILLKHTTYGLRMKAVGKNPKAARLMGISSSKYMLLAFLLCGLFAGLAGALQVTAVYYRLIPSISSGYGFMGLLVAMLVNYQVLWAIPVAYLFAALNIGGIQLPIEMH
jgi:simple sugar transport system permease protein